ncbi:uncharacterized protein BO97DRAFT_227184 [Aspergillus homomorphus CBS 101889]|uniref:Uncharacterized protein n=1 Tax=Aspergillus homomorphus (strain CBS 101889) TaxID=1450537 RepID=A0A395HL06_ASPHC|nr:hypothetical protein BO97DRAFT_227184 [Aspergillus homomorphus CBS 101889]RAL08113.1 hypothetical protein BO97DRAFT_227184 [Aspergillus homomorphus CBS 101889]
MSHNTLISTFNLFNLCKLHFHSHPLQHDTPISYDRTMIHLLDRHRIAFFLLFFFFFLCVTCLIPTSTPSAFPSTAAYQACTVHSRSFQMAQTYLHPVPPR